MVPLEVRTAKAHCTVGRAHEDRNILPSSIQIHACKKTTFARRRLERGAALEGAGSCLELAWFLNMLLFYCWTDQLMAMMLLPISCIRKSDSWFLFLEIEETSILACERAKMAEREWETVAAISRVSGEWAQRTKVHKGAGKERREKEDRGLCEGSSCRVGVWQEKGVSFLIN